MLDLRNGEMLDMLRSTPFAGDVEIQCLSYAIKQVVRMILDYADGAMVQAGIDGVSEDILDVLAVETNTQYYLQRMPESVKRDVIKHVLQWKTQAGTVAALSGVVESIFGNGHVEEWFDNGDSPGYFRVWAGSELDSDNVAWFMRTVDLVKNTRSHLKSVTCRMTGDLDGPEVDPGEIIPGYGDVDIYGEVQYTTEIHSDAEYIDFPGYSVKASVNTTEAIRMDFAIDVSVHEGETISASVTGQSDPCYLYNGDAQYNGSINYDSFYVEEEL